MSRAIGKRLRFSPNEDTEWDRVVALFSVNTVRTPMSLCSLPPTLP